MVAKAQYSKYNLEARPYLRWTNECAMGPFVIIDQEKTKTKFLVVIILPSTKSMTNDCD